MDRRTEAIITHFVMARYQRHRPVLLCHHHLVPLGKIALQASDPLAVVWGQEYAYDHFRETTV